MEERMRSNVFRLQAALAIWLGLALFAPGGASAVGVGKECGGIIGTPCDAGLFCEFKPGECNIFDNLGVCVRIGCAPRCFGRCAVATAGPTATTAPAAPHGLSSITRAAASVTSRIKGEEPVTAADF
jgi:hypothetical protein